MNYALGSSFNVDDLFMNFPTKKLKISCEECQQVNNDPHKDKLAKKIFRECYKTILNDVIDNNTTFILPTGGKKADIHMKRIDGEEFSRARRNGKFADVDFLESYFTGYELSFNMYTGRRERSKTIYVDPKLKQKIVDYTNSGKQYC